MTFRNTLAEPLLIVGASTRAAAFSTLAAGLQPQCVDLFADADLAACCTAVSAKNYPRDLPAIAAGLAPGPWVYTGALENHAGLIAEIARQRSLYGNSAHIVEQVRDPLCLCAVLNAAGLEAIEVRLSPAGLPRDGSWLQKPLRSSGGRNVTPWDENSAWQLSNKNCYFQRFVAGRSCAAIFLAGKNFVELLGATEQILLRAQHDRGAFTYAGSCGPLLLDDQRRRTLRAIGQALAESCGLVGLFGVDYVDDGQKLWPVEVNPRYTASVEILERASSISAMAYHVAACRGEQLPFSWPSAAGKWHAKRILYAPSDIVILPDFTAYAMTQRGDPLRPLVADIPVAGSAVPAGAPIMTIFGEGSTRAACEAALSAAECHWQQIIAAHTTPTGNLPAV